MLKSMKDGEYMSILSGVNDTVENQSFFGREVIYSPYKQSDLTPETIKTIIKDSMLIHEKNRREIDYLYNYYKGKQPILGKTKAVRPDINNIVEENHAFGVVEFKKGYVFGKPIQYVQRNEVPTDEISTLNDYMLAVDKHTKDTELAEWLYIAGLGHRVILPSKEDDEESPFTIENLDPRNTVVVYEAGIGHKPLLAFTYYTYEDRLKTIKKGSVYVSGKYYDFEYKGTKFELSNEQPLLFSEIPIIEYSLNNSRLGVVEVIMSANNILNKIASNDMDGIEQFIQSLVVFVNQDVDSEEFKELMQLGAVKIKSANPQMPADVKLLINELNNANTNIFYERTYNNMLTIIGVPRKSNKVSGGDTGQASLIGDGWTMADLRADQDEMMFKKGEKQILKMILKICKLNPASSIEKLTIKDVETKFERNKSDNLLVKTQSLTNLLTAQVAPDVAMGVVGLFSDPNDVYKRSKEYFGDKLWKKEKEAIKEPQNNGTNKSTNQ
jgi:SPP1 family phage portal protein